MVTSKVDTDVHSHFSRTGANAERCVAVIAMLNGARVIVLATDDTMENALLFAVRHNACLAVHPPVKAAEKLTDARLACDALRAQRAHNALARPLTARSHAPPRIALKTASLRLKMSPAC